MSGFDRIARFYDPLETVLAGGILERARRAHLGALEGRRSILSAGEGHGRFAALCSAAHPTARITCVDASGSMLERARHRVGDRANVAWVHAVLPDWRPAAAAHDAIVTCFFLDCFGPESLPAVVDSLAQGATRDAVWIDVDFSVPPRGFARWRARACLALMYAVFRRTCGIAARRIAPAGPELARHGFAPAATKHFNLGLVSSTLWRRG